MKDSPLVLVATLLPACTLTLPTGCRPYLEPIPGSVTYGRQPRTNIAKAPVGSIVPHQFIRLFGRRVYETYVIEPDRSLRLVSRRYDDYLRGATIDRRPRKANCRDRDAVRTRGPSILRVRGLEADETEQGDMTR